MTASLPPPAASVTPPTSRRVHSGGVTGTIAGTGTDTKTRRPVYFVQWDLPPRDALDELLDTLGALGLARWPIA